MKRIAAGALAAILCVGLSGCSGAQRPSEKESEIVLPEPSPELSNTILGERIASEPENVTLYYVSGDGTSFSTITRSMVVSPGESLYEEAVDALLYTTPERMTFVPAEMQVLDVEYACGMVTVSLSLDAHGISGEQELLMLIASVSNTLLSLKEVRGVNVLINGRSEGLASLPLGVQTELFSGVTPAYAKLSTEREFFLESDTGTISRSAALYFPAEVGDWLVPEIREITFDSSDYASLLIRALRAGPAENHGTVSAIPESADLLVNNPVTEVNSSGERVLQLDFAPALRNYLAFSGLEEWKLIGSIALTLCSFVPEIDAIRIDIGGETVTECRIGQRLLTFPDGLIRRSDFEACIGGTVELCLPNAEGALDVVERAVSMACAQSPQSVLYALFDSATSSGEDGGAFPSDVCYEDILGISVERGVASVNLSANFYRQSQALDATAERGVIYAIVNTLCKLENIDGVRFYIEGIPAETLSGSIYLKGVLLPNPGLNDLAVPEITASP